MNYEYQESYEFNPEMTGEFNYEMQENELAHELMGIQNEGELEYFLGNLLKSAWSGAKALYNSPAGQQLKNQAISGLKSFGKKALPGLGTALGGRFFGPAGAKFGGQLGNFAARGLGLEFEGISAKDKRFEGSKRLIRVARDASRRIAAYARSGRSLNASVIRNIILQSGRRWFPGISTSSSPGRDGYQQRRMRQDDGNYNSSGSQSQGSWYKQGNTIVLQGV